MRGKTGLWQEAFVTGIYAGLGQGGFDEQMLASLSDEAVFTHPSRGINIINEGTLNPSNIGWVNVNYRWGKDGGNNDMYAKIRQANVAIVNLRTATFDDKALNDRLKGESHFMRAFYYHQLVRFYGGVPIIDKPYGLGEDYSVTRNTWEECVDFIIKDCDTAILLLQGKTMAAGRASELEGNGIKGAHPVIRSQRPARYSNRQNKIYFNQWFCQCGIAGLYRRRSYSPVDGCQECRKSGDRWRCNQSL